MQIYKRSFPPNFIASRWFPNLNLFFTLKDKYNDSPFALNTVYLSNNLPDPQRCRISSGWSVCLSGHSVRNKNSYYKRDVSRVADSQRYVNNSLSVFPCSIPFPTSWRQTKSIACSRMNKSINVHNINISLMSFILHLCS